MRAPSWFAFWHRTVVVLVVAALLAALIRGAPWLAALLGGMAGG